MRLDDLTEWLVGRSKEYLSRVQSVEKAIKKRIARLSEKWGKDKPLTGTTVVSTVRVATLMIKGQRYTVAYNGQLLHSEHHKLSHHDEEFVYSFCVHSDSHTVMSWILHPYNPTHLSNLLKPLLKIKIISAADVHNTFPVARYNNTVLQYMFAVGQLIADWSLISSSQAKYYPDVCMIVINFVNERKSEGEQRLKAMLSECGVPILNLNYTVSIQPFYNFNNNKLLWQY